MCVGFVLRDWSVEGNMLAAGCCTGNLEGPASNPRGGYTSLPWTISPPRIGLGSARRVSPQRSVVWECDFNKQSIRISFNNGLIEVLYQKSDINDLQSLYPYFKMKHAAEFIRWLPSMPIDVVVIPTKSIRPFTAANSLQLQLL